MHIVPYLLSHPERERLVEAKRFALITNIGTGSVKKRCVTHWRKTGGHNKRRLLTLFATNRNLRNISYTVQTATMNVLVGMYNPCPRPARGGRVVYIGRGLRLFFYCVKGLRSPEVAWRMNELHAFCVYMYLCKWFCEKSPKKCKWKCKNGDFWENLHPV